MHKLSRQTSQKSILQTEAGKFKSFFTADELYQKIRRKDNRIGVATMYRFLRELRENNKIHSYMCNRKTIYSISEKNHCHFLCQQCGKVLHISVESIDFLKRNFKGEICHFQINVEGVCESCKAK